MKRFAIYARHTTQTGRNTQLFHLRTFVQRNGGEVVNEYSDSSTNGFDFEKAISDGQLKMHDCIVVMDTTRIARRITPLEMAVKSGVPIFTIENGQLNRLDFRDVLDQLKRQMCHVAPLPQSEDDEQCIS